MQAGIYMPLKFMDDINNLKLSDETKAKFEETKNVGKSKPCIFEIRNKKALKDFETVMHFKIQNK